MSHFNNLVYNIGEIYLAISSVSTVISLVCSLIKKLTENKRPITVVCWRIISIVFCVVSFCLIGYKSQLVQIPDVTGLTYAEACKEIEALNLTVEASEDSSNVLLKVSFQEPRGNTFALKRTKIHLSFEQEVSTTTTEESTTEPTTRPKIEEVYDEDGILLNGAIGVCFAGENIEDNEIRFVQYDFSQNRFIAFTTDLIPSNYCKVHIHFLNHETQTMFNCSIERWYSLFVIGNESFYSNQEGYVQVKLAPLIFMADKNDYIVYCQPGYYQFNLRFLDENYISNTYYISQSDEMTIEFYKKDFE